MSANLPDITKKEIKKNNEWHPQQAKLLKSWAEVASSYRWMHNQAYMIYKKKNLHFMLPLIIMSTVAGTANFAQSTFPNGIRPYVPQIIGAINLISAIMTTIYQFLKISEFMESHRISSINYGKLARTLTVELNLPVKDRNSGGAECVKVSRTEIDRLIEQSPAIPKNVLLSYESKFAGRGLSEPEIIVINQVDIYEDIENKTANTVAEAGIKLKGLLNKTPFLVKNTNSPTSRKNEQVKTEINSIKTNNTFSSIISELTNKIRPPSPKQIKLPLFESIPEKIINMENQIEQNQIEQNQIEQQNNQEYKQEQEKKEDINDPETIKQVDEVINELVDNVVQSTGGISDDLELLRSSKIVSSKKI
jgi:hypothetical protein